MTLRNKTISGIFWSFLQNVGSQGISIITIIVLARILTPRDFGLIGMLTIFIAISQALVQAGFNQALIQKKDTDEEDYSSVFYINLVASVLLYGILYFSAPLIANFYEQPILIEMTRVLSLIFVINAFSYVQEAKLRKEMRFKSLMFVHIPSTIISGIVAISMALTGFGVWSIVGMQLSMRLAYTVQLWLYAKWKPLWTFNKEKAKRLFSFGGNLMVASIINTIFQNIYLIVIGKFFPVNVLGYYQNAKRLVDTPTKTLSSVVGSVTFSAFSFIQDDDVKLKSGYRRIIQQMLFWICPMLIFAAILAKPLFSFVLTDKWLPAVPFFQLLCLGGILGPLNTYNLNIVKVKGRSDIFLKLEILKKTIVAIGVAATVSFGVWALVIFQTVYAGIAYVINSYYAGKFINYPMMEQVKDVLNIFVLTALTGTLVLLLDYKLNDLSNIIRLGVGLITGSGSYIILANIFKFKPLLEFKQIVYPKIQSRFKK